MTKKIAPKGLRSLKIVYSEFSRKFARKIKIIGAMSWDPGIVNHEVMNTLKANEKDTFFKIVFLNRFLMDKEIKNEKNE